MPSAEQTPANRRGDRRDPNALLAGLYAALWPRIVTVLGGGPDFSLPFLGACTADYLTCSRRLLVVGQQTRGWSISGLGGWREHRGGVELIPALMGHYGAFLSGNENKTGWFLRAAKSLQLDLNPGGPPYGFAWRNLFLVDQAGVKPREKYHDAVRSITPLQEEIAILQPKVVVFMTGPNYDFTVRHYFGSDCLERYSAAYEPEHVSRVKLPWPGMLGLRVPHPRVPRTRWVLKDIAKILAEL